MREKLDLKRLFGRSCAEVLEQLIDIIRNLEYRDYDFFFRELAKMEDEKLTEWSYRFLDFDPIEKMPEEEYVKLRPKLCVIGLANSDIYYVKNEKDRLLVDFPPTEDYSPYGMILVDGEEVYVMSRKQYIVDRFLKILGCAFSHVFSTDSDSHLCYLMAVRSEEDIDKYPVRNVWSHPAYVMLVTMEKELSNDYVSSGFEPAYEETLARLFRRVLSRNKIQSWKLSDIAYPLSRVEKAGKLILPEKKVSLLIDDSMDVCGDYWDNFRLMRVRSDTLSCITHETGHAADDEWGLSGSDEFAPVYEKFISLMSENDDFQPMEKYGYYSDRAECFARCYEMYLTDCGFFRAKRSLNGPYPEDKEFRSMIRDYFDRLTESLSKGIIETKMKIKAEEAEA